MLEIVNEVMYKDRSTVATWCVSDGALEGALAEFRIRLEQDTKTGPVEVAYFEIHFLQALLCCRAATQVPDNKSLVTGLLQDAAGLIRSEIHEHGTAPKVFKAGFEPLSQVLSAADRGGVEAIIGALGVDQNARLELARCCGQSHIVSNVVLSWARQATGLQSSLLLLHAARAAVNEPVGRPDFTLDAAISEVLAAGEAELITRLCVDPSAAGWDSPVAQAMAGIMATYPDLFQGVAIHAKPFPLISHSGFGVHCQQAAHGPRGTLQVEVPAPTPLAIFPVGGAAKAAGFVRQALALAAAEFITAANDAGQVNAGQAASLLVIAQTVEDPELSLFCAELIDDLMSPVFGKFGDLYSPRIQAAAAVIAIDSLLRLNRSHEAKMVAMQVLLFQLKLRQPSRRHGNRPITGALMMNQRLCPDLETLHTAAMKAGVSPDELAPVHERIRAALDLAHHEAGPAGHGLVAAWLATAINYTACCWPEATHLWSDNDLHLLQRDQLAPCGQLHSSGHSPEDTLALRQAVHDLLQAAGAKTDESPRDLEGMLLAVREVLNPKEPPTTSTKAAPDKPPPGP